MPPEVASIFLVIFGGSIFSLWNKLHCEREWMGARRNDAEIEG